MMVFKTALLYIALLKYLHISELRWQYTHVTKITIMTKCLAVILKKAPQMILLKRIIY